MASMPIVVGADGSEQSSRAVEWAAREAVRRKAPLRIVSVSVMPSRMRPRNANPATVADILHKISARNLAAALTRAREVAPGLLIDTDLVAGPPAQTLTACGSGASMLVVGARGEGGFTAMVLGSVSRYVAMHAPCPVVVAHEDSVAVHREVVAGVGEPAESADSLGFAFEEASMRGARLLAVHALARYPASSAWDDEDLKLAGWLQRRAGPGCRRRGGRTTRRVGRGGRAGPGSGRLAGEVPRSARRRGCHPRSCRPRAGQLLGARRSRGDRPAR